LAAALTIESARVLCRRRSARGNYMSMHSLAARTHSSKPSASRPTGLRTQLMARGPGWRLAEGEDGTWLIKLIESDDSVATWAHMLRTLRTIAETHGVRATVIDLRGGSRLAGATASVAALLLAEFEQRELRIATVVGADLIHAARLHRLMGISAATQGRSFASEDEAIEWVRQGVPPNDSLRRHGTSHALAAAQPTSPPVPLSLPKLRSLTLQPPRV
jgi:hypothetical protein